MNKLPLYIELVGCSGAGKTMFGDKLVRRLLAEGVPVESNHPCHFTLGGALNPWLNSPRKQNLFLDVRATALLGRAPKARNYIKQCYSLISHSAYGALSRANLHRSIRRKAGLYETWRAHEGRDVIVHDEGLVHAAHYLLAGPDYLASPAKCDLFASFIPLPDVIVYLTVDKNTAFERARLRDDPPMNTTPDRLRTFLANACDAFDRVARYPRVAERTIILDSANEIDENIKRFFHDVSSRELSCRQ